MFRALIISTLLPGSLENLISKFPLELYGSTRSSVGGKDYVRYLHVLSGVAFLVGRLSRGSVTRGCLDISVMSRKLVDPFAMIDTMVLWHQQLGSVTCCPWEAFLLVERKSSIHTNRLKSTLIYRNHEIDRSCFADVEVSCLVSFNVFKQYTSPTELQFPGLCIRIWSTVVKHGWYNMRVPSTATSADWNR